MMNQGQRFYSIKMDIESVIRPFEEERRYLQKLRKSSLIEPILLHLFDLLKPDDYSLLFSCLNRDKFDRKWLEIFSKFCMQRYLEFDEIFFHEKFTINSTKSESNSKSILENYTNYLIEHFLNSFSIEYFQAIIKEFEYLNQFKIDQLTKQLNENNQLIQKLFLLFNHDDSIIHLSSTPAQLSYENYKPIHMIYLKTEVIIFNDEYLNLSTKSVTNKFVADLSSMKSIEILDESTGQTSNIPTKDLYFAKSCESNVILPLKLRVLISDRQMKRFRWGIIGEEACKNNHFRHLIFFIDQSSSISANYYSSSNIHICLNQIVDYQNEFLKNYFQSYPERFMLRVKEGSIIKIRHLQTNLSALVIKIDCSMMLIEYIHSKEQIWIYRGSPLIEQMNNYYSTQNRSNHHSARQHLSAKKTNAPEIICLNEQTKMKFSRMNSEDNSSLKRLKITDENYQIVKTIPSRTNQNNLIIDRFFLQLAEHFLFYQSRIYQPHYCSNKCIQFAERSLKDLSKTTNPFLKPIACQWTILETIRIKKARDIRVKNTRSILIYCTPCGKKLYNETQVDNYLSQTKSQLTIELFVFDSTVNIRQSYSTEGKILNRDISNGEENVPIMCVNEVDNDVPHAFTYRVERMPVEGVNMVLNESTMTCCQCTDGCRNRAQCACWLRTLKYAELIGDDRVKSMRAKHKSDADILYQLGYGYRRLHKNVPGGIYECNSRCSCNRKTCSNRVVQNGIIAQLQLFKTVGRGWGVRTLHDLPLGTFISVYSGEIFTSEQADERGKLIGDEYQADLDFFENINNDSDDENHSSSESENEENQNPFTRNTRSCRNDSKKSSKSTRKTTDNHSNSVLNRTVLPEYDGIVYTLDAKLVGNIGRYFNHSCSPNIAVQNVFVDTHDIHFPWIGFFTMKSIRAGTELCWDYNYTVGEIAGRRMDCNCGSSECRRRVL